MYLTKSAPKRGRLNGLGIWETVIPLVVAAVAESQKEDGGGGGGMPASAAPGMPQMAPQSPATVSPAIQTQVSPQISPIFQQQFQPTNSAATAGTSQTMPTSQLAPGSPYPRALPNAGDQFPGFPSAGGGGGFPAPLEAGIFQDGTGSPLSKYLPFIVFGALGLFAFAMMQKRKPEPAEKRGA